MKQPFKYTCVILLAVLSCSAAWAAPEEKNPCQAPFWEPYRGDAMVAELTVQLKANTVVTEDDTYFLKLLDKKGKALGYIRLLIPKSETGVIVYDFAEPIPAADILSIELFSPEKDVHMTWMNVSAELDGEMYTFFDHECTGVTIGPGGCKRMHVV